MRIKEQRLVFFDTETTGGDSKNDKAIELAVLGWQNGKADDGGPLSWLINPLIPIKPAASAVHHLTQKDIANSPPIEEVLPLAENYIKDSVISAHNASFDLDIIPSWSKYQCIDTLRVVRHIWPIGELNPEGQPLCSHTMQELRYWLNLEIDTMGLAAHRAAADILVTAYVYDAAIDYYLAHGGYDDFDDFMLFVKEPIITERVPFGETKGQPLLDQSMEILNKIRFWATKNNDQDLLLSIDQVIQRKIPPGYKKAA